MSRTHSGLVTSLKEELQYVDEQMGHLVAYREALKRLIDLHDTVHAEVPQRHLRAVDRPVPPIPFDEEPPVEVPVEETPIPDQVADANASLSTLEMARTVLRNSGRTMNLVALRAAIIETYGVEPARTLDQMLYKRAQKGKGFYKTADGEFGVVEPEAAGESRPTDRPAPIVEQVSVPTTALA